MDRSVTNGIGHPNYRPRSVHGIGQAGGGPGCALHTRWPRPRAATGPPFGGELVLCLATEASSLPEPSVDAPSRSRVNATMPLSGERGASSNGRGNGWGSAAPRPAASARFLSLASNDRVKVATKVDVGTFAERGRPARGERRPAFGATAAARASLSFASHGRRIVPASRPVRVVLSCATAGRVQQFVKLSRQWSRCSRTPPANSSRATLPPLPAGTTIRSM